MSVLIKCMDMPKNCTLCFLRDDFHDYCPYEKNKETDCPLVEVSVPHGRLIDADRLLWEEGQMSVIQDAAYGRGREEMKDAIRNAPTVIEAEEAAKFVNTPLRLEDLSDAEE